MDLPGDDDWIDLDAAIMRHDVAQDAQASRARLDLDQASMGGIGIGHGRRIEGCRYMQAGLHAFWQAQRIELGTTGKGGQSLAGRRPLALD
jgi:hypothetical protein